MKVVLIFKCKCGCFFTMENRSLDQRRIRCSNCANTISLFRDYTLVELSSELHSTGMSVDSIPDNAKISIAFEA